MWKAKSLVSKAMAAGSMTSSWTRGNATSAPSAPTASTRAGLTRSLPGGFMGRNSWAQVAVPRHSAVHPRRSQDAAPAPARPTCPHTSRRGRSNGSRRSGATWYPAVTATDTTSNRATRRKGVLSAQVTWATTRGTTETSAVWWSRSVRNGKGRRSTSAA